MRKFKFFLDYEKEERWLCDMAQQGYHLKKAGFGYRFDNAPPEQAVFKIDFRNFKKQRDFLDSVYTRFTNRQIYEIMYAIKEVASWNTYRTATI